MNWNPQNAALSVAIIIIIYLYYRLEKAWNDHEEKFKVIENVYGMNLNRRKPRDLES